MNSFRLIVRSLTHHARTHAAVALGVLAATAVLTGALVVGDSVRASLRRLTLERLGRVERVLVTDRFFRAELAEELASAPGMAAHYPQLLPAILLPNGTLEGEREGRATRAGSVTVLAVGPEFWELHDPQFPAVAPARHPERGEVVLNAPLAEQLGARVGDRVALRLARLSNIPADSPLAKKDDRVRSLGQLEVVGIVPGEGLGRFALRPNQSLPLNAFVSLETLQQGLATGPRVNAVLAAHGERPPADAAQAAAALRAALRPTLEDYGFTLKPVEGTYTDQAGAQQTSFRYWSLSSDRMLLEPAAERAAAEALAPFGGEPALTYLANEIALGGEPVQPQIESLALAGALLPAPFSGIAAEGVERLRARAVPYSTVTALPPSAALGPLRTGGGEPLPLAAGEIALPRWSAENLGAEVGDPITLSYFEPESSHGVTRERVATFRLAAVLELTEPEEPFGRRRPAQYKQPPTWANDPDLTPTVPGITDAESMDRWDAPFPFSYSRLRDADETYWDNHRTTPKAYVNFEAGRELWGSRFGGVTTYRVPDRPGVTEEALRAALLAKLRPEELGFRFEPVRESGLAASQGTTPFNLLFLGFSFFIILSALMLVALLFRLGLEQRAGQIGVLLAVGLRRGKVARLLAAEAMLVAALGGILGTLGGVAYAWLMLAGLRTWWVEAVVTPFLHLSVHGSTLALGFLCGLATCGGVIVLTLRGLRKLPLRELVAGRMTAPARGYRPARWPLFLAGALLLAGMALAGAALSLGGEARAGAFFGAGGALLAAELVWVWRQLGSAYWRPGNPRLTLPSLAYRNAARNPGRSTLTIGLVAAASFLIAALSAFRMEPNARGTGGFTFLGRASEPVFENLNTPAGRAKKLDEAAPALEGADVFAFRFQPGDDASCRNLYQASRPQALGATPEFIASQERETEPGFAFAATAAATEEERRNPWRLLAGPTPPGEPVPVFLDQNTAMYALHLYEGIGQRYAVTYEDGRTIEYRVAGLLAGSVLQGALILGEADFEQLFPEVSGYRFFLVRAPAGRAGEVRAALEEKLSYEGFAAEPADRVLAELQAVQNTYLSTFQSLGGLGLLLGTFGLVAVQLRNVVQRRGELALMRAEGFRLGRLAALVLLENACLLAGGLLLGVLAALVAVLPHMLLGGAQAPWGSLALLLGVVLAVGLGSGWLAARRALAAPLLPALRGD